MASLLELPIGFQKGTFVYYSQVKRKNASLFSLHILPLIQVHV